MAKPLRSPKDADNQDSPRCKGSVLSQIFRFLMEWRREKQEHERKLIMVLDDLNAAVAANTTALGLNTSAVNALIVAYQTPNPSDAAIVAATTQVNANTAGIQANTEAINKALAPTPPPPPAG